MADFIETPTGIQLMFVGMYLGQEVSNVINLDYGAVPAADEISSITTVVGESWGANVVPWLNGAYDYNGCIGRGLASSMAPTYQYTPPVPTSGGYDAALQTASGAQALCVTLRTGMTGRSGRGRLFIAGVVRSTTDPNYAKQTQAEAIEAGLRRVWSDIAGLSGGMMWCVLSKYHNGQPREQGLLTEITNIQLRNYRLDSQRRRAPKD
jgi:hypothetical protein